MQHLSVTVWRLGVQDCKWHFTVSSVGGRGRAFSGSFIRALILCGVALSLCFFTFQRTCLLMSSPWGLEFQLSRWILGVRTVYFVDCMQCFSSWLIYWSKNRTESVGDGRCSLPRNTTLFPSFLLFFLLWSLATESHFTVPSCLEFFYHLRYDALEMWL